MKLSKINEMINRPTIEFGEVKLVIGKSALETEIWVNETKLNNVKSVEVKIEASEQTKLTLEIYSIDGARQTMFGEVEFFKTVKKEMFYEG